MGNLWSKYSRLENSYYNISIQSSNCIKNKFNNDSCREFIQEHFNMGAKSKALYLPFQEKFEKNGKHQHTVALYFLGLHLQKLFDEKLWLDLNGRMPKWESNNFKYKFEYWYDFRYTWFLTCLYHDTASCIEQSNKGYFLPERKKTLDYHLGKYNIQYTPYSHVPLRRAVMLVRFSEPLIKNYFDYRTDNGCLDHGIIGGYYLFDRLYKSFYEHTSYVDWEKVKEKEQNNLSYRLEHLDHFAYIADAIICHNLWYAYKAKNIETYREYGLDPLILGEGSQGVQTKKLNINDYPLQFTLCLLDSIEPVKRFTEDNNISAYDVLCTISIEEIENKKGIKIEWDSWLEQQNKFDKWMRGIKELAKWMDVTVTQSEGENSVTIDFNCQ